MAVTSDFSLPFFYFLFKHLHGNRAQWGSSLNLLAANGVSTVLILCEHVMSAHFSQQVAAVQLTPSQLSLYNFGSGSQLSLRADTHIKGVCVAKVRISNPAPQRASPASFWSGVDRFSSLCRIQWPCGTGNR